ncbi:branched-chain amino acid ABC transporter permease [Oceanobacillus longus]|uniref:Branched-chain amino acid ABC transporter permease n=1 Tax=Oceanobacillus longus TaxID=930120 RepID=A0ABV8GVU4_9BACI
MKSILANRRLWLILLVGFMLVYPFIFGQSGYYITIFVMVSIYIISAMSLNLLAGNGGQMSVGQAGFLTIGGYTVAILSTTVGLPLLVVLPLAGIVTGLIGLIIGLPAVRLKGHFLAVATLGFGLSIPQIALNWDSLTGGYSGMAVSRPEWLSGNLELFYVVILIVIVVIWAIHNILKSSLGRAFMAIRESEVAAQSTGINLAFYKTVMFMISAFFTGIAGGIYGYWFGYVSPNDFTIATSFLLLAMVVVGGLASIPGAIIGAILFTILPEFTRSFVGLNNIIIGLAVILVILFLPRGLVSITELFKKKSQVKKEETEIIKEVV